MAAVPNNHKFNGLEQHKCIILRFGDQKTKMEFTGLSVGCAAFLIEALGENSLSRLFQLIEALHVLWLMASFIFKVSKSELSSSGLKPF